MSELNDRDWELVNAYHDDELTESERSRMDLRLASEPALADALRDVTGASVSLASLRPEIPQRVVFPTERAANSNWKPRRWIAGGALALAITAAVVFGNGNATPTVQGIHADFAARAFSTEEDDLRLVATFAQADTPDLAGANLMPVSHRTVDAGDVTHYTGRNGCRLTYFRGNFALDQAGRTDGYQIAEWTTPNNLRHLIVATGMDQTRFDAIALYLKRITQSEPADQVMATAIQATKTRPCIG